MPECLTLGETMAAFAPDRTGPLRYVPNYSLRIAGAESNTAIGAAKLGVSAAWISRLGADEFGQYIRNQIRAEGVDCSGVHFDPAHRTGVMFKQTGSGESSVFYYRENSAASHMTPQDLDEALFRGCRILHLSGITPVLSESCAETVQAAMEDAWAGETWQCGVTFAVRGGPTELALTWKDVTVTVGESGELWVKLSRPELAALTPDAAAAWLLEQYGAIFGEQTRYFMAARDSGGCSLYFYRPEEDLTQGILQRSILKTWVRLSGGSCEVRLYRPELSDANTVGAYPLVTVDQARQRLAAGQHLSAWEPFPGEDRVKRVDLQYLARQTDRYFMPYYVFWVECDDGEQGVCYRPYYVPAVADAYIAGMPQSPTGAA